MKLLNDPECAGELRLRLEKIGPATPARWGQMNSAQMICHLSDCFLSIMGDRPMEIPRGFSLWPLMKWFSLYAPVKWPKGIPTRPEFDQLAGGGTPPAQFEADVRILLNSIRRFAAQPRTFQFRPHPMFKEMSERDWMRWGYRHVDHHLRQFGQ